jgi:hypothetical protein
VTKMSSHKIELPQSTLDEITLNIADCYFVNRRSESEMQDQFVSDMLYRKIFPSNLSSQDISDVLSSLALVDMETGEAVLDEYEFTNVSDIIQFMIDGILEHTVDAHIFALENITDMTLRVYASWSQLIEKYQSYVFPKHQHISKLQLMMDKRHIWFKDPLFEAFNIYMGSDPTNRVRKFDMTDKLYSALKDKFENELYTVKVSCYTYARKGVVGIAQTEAERPLIEIYSLSHIFKNTLDKTRIVQRHPSEICALLAHTTLHEFAHIIEDNEPEMYFAICGEFERVNAPKYDFFTGQSKAVKEIIADFNNSGKQAYFGHGARFKLFTLYVGHKLGFIRDDMFHQIKEVIQLQDVEFVFKKGDPILTKTGKHKTVQGRKQYGTPTYGGVMPEKLEGEEHSDYLERVTYTRWESAIEDEFINAMASEKRPVVVPQSFVKKTRDLNATLTGLDPKLGIRNINAISPRSNYAESKSGAKARLLTYNVLETSDGVLNHYLIDSDEPFMNIYDCLGASQSRTVNVSEFQQGVPFLGITLKGNAICPIYVDGFSRQVHEISLEEYWWILSL